MRLINTFILAKKTGDDFIGIEAVRKRMSCLLTKKEEKKEALRYLAFDGRKDKTLMPKNQIAREEHMTFISTNGYVAHEACENKKAKTIASKVVKILKHHDSLEKVQILSTDAEPANTGWKGKKKRILFLQ